MNSWKELTLALAAVVTFSVSSALAQSLPAAKPESVGMSSARLLNLKQTLQAEVDKGNIPGAVVMINRRGKLVYSEAVGYQNKDANLPMRKDSIFRIYSMTKPLAEVAAMILAEEGKNRPGRSRQQVSTRILQDAGLQCQHGCRGQDSVHLGSC
jgi:CubicO group peptidase (beta-lactamase class C family)